MLSQVLSGQPYRSIGAPQASRDGPTLNKDLTLTSTQGTGGMKNPELITLALDTLGSFNFKGHILNEMARTCVLPYLEDDFPEVRRSAAITCCGLFVNDPITYHVSNHAIEVISDVVDKLLVVGIADPGRHNTIQYYGWALMPEITDPSIRQTVLSSLHERFDKHLAQAENVRSLFIALNDEVFENRLTAVNLIGRLATHNPAYVMPSLRKSLIQLLTELEYSTVQ
jgi:FKBP12-rapamycin complex-associated protein